MRGRDSRSAVGAIGQAGLLLLMVAVAARVIYNLLAPLLPTLLAITFVMALAAMPYVRRQQLGWW